MTTASSVKDVMRPLQRSIPATAEVNKRMVALHTIFFPYILSALSQSSLPCSAGCLGNSEGPSERTWWKKNKENVDPQTQTGCWDLNKTNTSLYLQCRTSVNLFFPPLLFSTLSLCVMFCY